MPTQKQPPPRRNSAPSASLEEGRFREAVALHGEGRLKEAAALYEALLREAPNHPGVLANYGSLLRRMNRSAEAVSLLTKAAQAAPRAPEIWFNLGNAQLAAGAAAEAERSFRKALILKPDFSAIHFNLGNAFREQGKLSEAARRFQRYLTGQPEHAVAHANLGNVLRRLGRHREGEAAHRRAIELTPENGGFHFNLANLLAEIERGEEALASFEQAIELSPENASVWRQEQLRLAIRLQRWEDARGIHDRATTRDGHQSLFSNLLGDALQKAGRLDEALEIYELAIERGAADAALFDSAGVACQARGDLDRSESCLRKAIALDPDRAVAWSNLGMLLLLRARHEAAISALEEALRRQPLLAIAHANIALVFLEVNELSRAVHHCQEAIAIDPDLPQGHFNLAPALVGQGRLPEAFAAFEAGRRAAPDDLGSFSSYLFALNYSDRHAPEAVAEAHQGFGPLVDHLLQDPPPHFDPDPERPLRIGYVSPDLFQHPVGLLLAPILAHHDRSRFQAICFDSGLKRDRVTENIRANAVRWRNIARLSDDEAFALIREERIDILVDLTGHTKGNRLRLFARRPAPLQVSYAGYVHSTGLAAMDYVIQDRQTMLPGEEGFYTERIMALPCALYCYEPPEPPPAVVPTPALRRGHVTFGSFNNLPKLTPTTLDLWAALLKAAPGARLLLKSGPFFDLPTRTRFAKAFQERGIDPARVEITGPAPFFQYLEGYGGVDLALDPLPFNGGITSLQGLWQGVPFVTLRGDSHVSRVGASILTGLDLPELIAETSEDYIDKALAATGDLEALNRLRLGMRDRLKNCTVGDPARFTPILEGAFQEMWRERFRLGEPVPTEEESTGG